MNKEELPKFKMLSPTNAEEKLIVELLNLLIDTTINFSDSHCTDEISPGEIPVVLRDASIAYASYIIKSVYKMIKDKDYLCHFIEECKSIFNCSIEELNNE